jgi:trehalose 6-phosphate synthase
VSSSQALREAARRMDDRIDLEDSYWQGLVKSPQLGILTDLDGALIPFASRPELARPSPELIELLDELANLSGVALAIVSGRPRASLDELFPAPRRVVLFAEHGGWWRSPSGWQAAVSANEHAIDALFLEVSRLSATIPHVILERKTWSMAVHFRAVRPSQRASFLVELSATVQPWLDAHPDFEPLWGAEVLEVRPTAARKSIAVAWMRKTCGADCRLLVVGDDTTDEDMFAAAGEGDATVLVESEAGRATAARWRLESTDDVHSLYREIVAVRKGTRDRPARKRMRSSDFGLTTPSYRLLVVSNRLPEFRSAEAAPSLRQRNVGGLVSALRPVLEAREGIWLGWSGRTLPGLEPSNVGRIAAQGLAFASVDFPEEWHRHYYNGLSNGALWPLLHSFPSRVRFSHADWRSYVNANEAFAAIARRLVGADATLWVHDYHLFLMAKAARAHGHRGPIGFFQHVPFPGPDLFFILPWANDLLEAMLAFDLVGFHTQSYVENFLRCMATLPNVRVEGQWVVAGQRRLRVGSFPLGIMPEQFQEAADSSDSEEAVGLIRALGTAPIVLGVDRLDYTKGIPERIDAFGRLLQLFPEWRRKVCLVQVSVPSRADVRDYAEQRTRVENSVGRINGEFGTADWVPIRYLYRAYGRAELSQLYRVASVGYVTPLRDGMNLVAKEFVASQDPESPGVLVLSRFAGAAEELRDALLTNPWDTEGTARDLDRALRMPLDERKARHARLQEAVSRTTALTWAEDFLGALEAHSRSQRPDRC